MNGMTTSAHAFDGVMTPAHALGGALRAWRDRLSPSDVGLSPVGRRRAHGLRREELAALAAVSVDYLVRLEQGRAHSPSPQVVAALARALQLDTYERDYLYTLAGLLPPVAALARALQLDTYERDYLYTLAGLLPPVAGSVSIHIPPSVRRLIARLGDIPLAVFAADWTLVLWTPLWASLIGDPLALDPDERNLVHVVFLTDGAGRHPSWPVRSERGEREFETALVSDLRIAAAAHPHDERLRDLIERAASSSPRFADLWTSGTVQPLVGDRKTIAHPHVGSMTLDCDVLTVPGADLKLVAYTAPEGSPDAEKMDRLRVAGIRTVARASDVDERSSFSP